jgi:hypothetical protein
VQYAPASYSGLYSLVPLLVVLPFYKFQLGLGSSRRPIPCLLRFRGLGFFYFYFLLGAFLFKSLGADSSKRPRTPSGAHQWGFHQIKDNTAFCDLRPNYVSCIIQKILIEYIVIECIIIPGQYSLQFNMDSFASFHSYHCYFTNNNQNGKRRNLTPST